MVIEKIESFFAKHDSTLRMLMFYVFSFFNKKKSILCVYKNIVFFLKVYSCQHYEPLSHPLFENQKNIGNPKRQLHGLSGNTFSRRAKEP